MCLECKWYVPKISDSVSLQGQSLDTIISKATDDKCPPATTQEASGWGRGILPFISYSSSTSLAVTTYLPLKPQVSKPEVLYSP